MNPQAMTPMLDVNPEGSTQMLLYENLARSRMREAEQVARAHRLVRRMSAVKRWERLSGWAARRAERVRPVG